MTTVVRKNSLVLRSDPRGVLQRANRTVLKKLQGMWRDRKPDPIKELARMRKEW